MSHLQLEKKSNISKKAISITHFWPNLKNVSFYSSLVYTWGLISSKGGVIYKQAKPHMQPAQNIIDFSCGSSSILAIDDRGDVFCLGNN